MFFVCFFSFFRFFFGKHGVLFVKIVILEMLFLLWFRVVLHLKFPDFCRLNSINFNAAQPPTSEKSLKAQCLPTRRLDHNQTTVLKKLCQNRNFHKEFSVTLKPFSLTFLNNFFLLIFSWPATSLWFDILFQNGWIQWFYKSTNEYPISEMRLTKMTAIYNSLRKRWSCPVKIHKLR